MKMDAATIASANGAASCQPRATPWEMRPSSNQGLKARANDREIWPGLQPSCICDIVTQGVALGCYETGALPLGNPPTAALDAESAEVLGNIKALL